MRGGVYDASGAREVGTDTNKDSKTRYTHLQQLQTNTASTTICKEHANRYRGSAPSFPPYDQQGFLRQKTPTERKINLAGRLRNGKSDLSTRDKQAALLIVGADPCHARIKATFLPST